MLQADITAQEDAAGALHGEAPQQAPAVQDSPASMYELGGQSQTQQRPGAAARQGSTRWAAACPASSAPSADLVCILGVPDLLEALEVPHLGSGMSCKFDAVCRPGLCPGYSSDLPEALKVAHLQEPQMLAQASMSLVGSRLHASTRAVGRYAHELDFATDSATCPAGLLCMLSKDPALVSNQREPARSAARLLTPQLMLAAGGSSTLPG